jgi:DNA-binding HxlR family transcriptional regulator
MDSQCTVNLTVKYLTKKWTLLIILELFKGDNYTRRFSELRRSLPEITPKILSERLQELKAEGIITNTVDASVIPVRSEYTLTPAGIELMEIVKAIKYWALTWKIDNLPCGSQECKLCKL